MLPIERRLVVPWEQATTRQSSPQEAWLWVTFSSDAALLGLWDREIRQVYVDSLAKKPATSQPAPTWPAHKGGSGTVWREHGGGPVLAPAE